MDVLEISIFQYIESVCEAAPSLSNLAVFVSSVSLTTTLLQGSHQVKMMWVGRVEKHLSEFGKHYIKQRYAHGEFSENILPKVRDVVSSHLQTQVKEYKRGNEMKRMWKIYTMEVYLCCLLVAILLFFSPENFIQIFYLFSVYPMLHLGATLLRDWRSLHTEAEHYISDEQMLKKRAATFSQEDSNF